MGGAPARIRRRSSGRKTPPLDANAAPFIDVVAARSPYAPQAPLSQLAEKARAQAETVLEAITQAERRSPWEATQDPDLEKSDDDAVAHAVGELARVSEELNRACSEELNHQIDEEDE